MAFMRVPSCVADARSSALNETPYDTTGVVFAAHFGRIGRKVAGETSEDAGDWGFTPKLTHAFSHVRSSSEYFLSIMLARRG